MIKTFFKQHTPTAALPVARAVYNGVDALRIRKRRSYLHGLLFDLKGGDYETEGMTFQIPSEQFPRSYRSRLYFDIYEAAERVLVKKWIAPDAKVLELGGCVGVLSCVINRLLDNPARHVVVEANPTLIDALRVNRDANGCGFAIENCLISRDPVGSFFIAGVMTANRKDSGRGREVVVKTCSVEELSNRHGTEFDTLVLDIEGGEFDFFKENQKLLRSANLVILELHRNILTDEKLQTCRFLLSSAGLSKVDEEEETEVWKRLSN